jgi:glycine/D-amino acid oxidase-like deaminating enzyme
MDEMTASLQADPELRRLSLWWDDLVSSSSDGPIARRAALDADLDVDVAIVGGGYTGLWTAYYLIRHDPTLRIAILDANVCGFGASGRNGGWCSALFPASLAKIARTANRDAAIALQRAMHDTVDEVGRAIAAEGIDARWSKGGTISLARSALQWSRAQGEIDEWRQWGFGADDYALLGADETRRRFGATDVVGGTYTPHCAAIHPARLARGLADVVESAGVRIYEDTRVAEIAPQRVTANDVTVRADIVVRAAEGYTAALPGYERHLVPVYSLMIATEPLSDSTWASIGLRRRETFNDKRHLIIYGQRTADDRLAFGGRGAPYHFGSQVRPEFDRDARVFDALYHVLCDLLPAVRGSRVTHTWGGPLGVPRDWYASCGLDRSTGLAWSGGYVGDGVGTSNLGGRTLADLILDRDTERRRLPWVDHRSPRWEPEPLRWLGTNIGLLTMASADVGEARTGRPSRRAALFGRFTGH